ncbi:hypothetical protein B0H63DRAFT_518976 [Podospora didyma]|uniref:Uncharacterized protein n=1 Tax=Podospora didyma TaxID=330526 RepID=A0AAE0NYH2_9PEZI|nr:hypothetical protein B0H63DRAFT_518976 [Podospora didyma]
MASISIVIPTELKQEIRGKPIFLLNANNRGDMYHIRVARSLKPGPLIIYGCNDNTKELQEYCSQIQPRTAMGTSPNHVIFTSSDRPGAVDKDTVYKFNGTTFSKKELTDPAKIKVTTETIDEKYVITEDKATAIIAGELGKLSPITTTDPKEKKVESKQTMEFLTRIRMSTALLDENQRSCLDVEFKKTTGNPFVTKFGTVPNDNNQTSIGTRVLILHRDSGVQPDGPYPELDTGAALSELVAIINTKGHKAIVAGDAEANGAWTIGKYWKHPVWKTVADYEILKGVGKRDRVAYMLEWAYRKGYFKMAVGFRSGVLDMLSFLGVPTVSISLRHLEGESRHNLLAKPILNRVNVFYNVSRHEETVWNSGVKVLLSPVGPQLSKTPKAKKVEPRKAPGGFTDMDNVTVRDAMEAVMAQVYSARSPAPRSIYTSRDALRSDANNRVRLLPEPGLIDYKVLRQRLPKKTALADGERLYPELAAMYNRTG